MTIKLDSSEVLLHLNKYGIHSIDEDAFKKFMKDLKKLIKYEQRKNESPVSQHKENAVAASHVDCNCDVQISSCCPASSARVTYIQSPCKPNQKLLAVSGDKEAPRSASSSLYAKSQYKNKRKKVKDPVELYHYYQSIWKQHTLPGENDHTELRQSIRNRLMHKN